MKVKEFLKREAISIGITSFIYLVFQLCLNFSPTTRDILLTFGLGAMCGISTYIYMIKRLNLWVQTMIQFIFLFVAVSFYAYFSGANTYFQELFHNLFYFVLKFIFIFICIFMIIWVSFYFAEKKQFQQINQKLKK